MSRDSKEYTWTWKNAEERMMTPISTTTDAYKIGLQQDLNYEYELQENGTWLNLFLDGDKPTSYVLFTPDFDYVKEPYWARLSPEHAPVLCYPNGGTMHEMGGKGRVFKACEVEVKYAGWEADQHHPMHKRKK